MPSISQLPAVIQAVSGADVLILEQTATGGSSPGTATVVQAPVSSVVALVAAINQSALTAVSSEAAAASAAVAAETARAEAAEAALAASSSGSITNAPAATTMATTDTVGISTEGAEHQITLSNLLTAAGTSISALPAASVAAAGDEFVAIQSSAAVLQTNAGLMSYVAAQIPGLRQPVVLLTANTVLDGSVHNGAILVCENAITISPAASFSSISSGFYCTLINMSGGAVTFASGITTSGGTTLAAGLAATLTAFTYSGGNAIFANLGGTTTSTPGVTVGVSSSSVTTGSPISVVGQVNPGGTAIQVVLGTSATVVPTSGWASATVSGTSFTASVATTTAGTFYVWARETANTSIQAVSGAVTVSSTSASVTITSPPTTGTTGAALSFAGTVAPSATAVQVALGTSASTAPTSGFTSATVSGTGWTASLTPSTSGTYYIWAQQTATPSVYAVSAAITISAASQYATILAQSGATTWSNSSLNIPSTLSLSGNNGTVGLNMAISPTNASGATVTAYWTATEPTSLPSSGQMTGGIGPLFNGGTVDAYLGVPTSTGVWYLSLWIANNGSNNGYVVLTPITWTA